MILFFAGEQPYMCILSWYTSACAQQWLISSKNSLKVGGVIQFVDEGQFIKYFCPLMFVKGLQFAIIWTEECLH